MHRLLQFDTSEWDRFAKNLGNTKIFKDEMMELTENLAKFLLDNLYRITPVKTGQLRMAWTKKTDIVVKPTKTGYEVKLVNTCPYANYVNNGHFSYNQYNVGGDPYVVHNRTVPLDPNFGGDFPNEPTYVYGRFFVENSVLQAHESGRLQQIIMDSLNTWWEWC